MKKNGLLVAALLLFATQAAFSQTSRIAHRSHSGKNSTFNALGEDHLGLPSEYQRKKIKSSDTAVTNHLSNPPAQDSTQNGSKKKPAKDANRQKKTTPKNKGSKSTKSL